MTPEPQHLAVRDEDNRQILEDSVHRNTQELEGLCRGVDHADKEEGDGEPFARLVGVEVAEGDDAHRLTRLDC